MSINDAIRYVIHPSIRSLEAEPTKEVINMSFSFHYFTVLFLTGRQHFNYAYISHGCHFTRWISLWNNTLGGGCTILAPTGIRKETFNTASLCKVIISCGKITYYVISQMHMGPRYWLWQLGEISVW